ncbi:hypothetical protein LK994_06825 [Ferruginibacter lapsinanis]|uniref:hypothetical protein n=1 Tax=Ferruginibacter lapsinanis TaxID=563172 RepID=UPI001E3832E2|nr:hypothetical protein [Ferruginibacter lapsinanis]UEG51187.1 hypothetical protein LK994_06825 [Ferruginibacter lapsinanis]
MKTFHNSIKIVFLLLIASCSLPIASQAQVNAVEFGRNRLQFKKFKWEYYQTKNFNIYFNQNGQELAKFVAQIAERELPGIESFTEYNLQRRANIIVYNEFADLKQSNIGLGTDWQTTGGLTKLVNNKMVVYFNGDHQHLLKQIREGIAKILTDNVLFGDDFGEIAGNQALLDLPQWLTDGYIAFAGNNWSTELDDELKSELLSGNYRNFYDFAFEQPLLAGHSFWYFIQEKYKKENVTYLLYLARIYKNLNKACQQVCKKKFRDVLAEFMEYETDKYEKDITRRNSYPKGKSIESFDINKRLDYYKINVNPAKKNNSYAMVQYKKGITRIILNEDYNNTTLIKYGIRNYKNASTTGYPILAWNPKGTRLMVIYKKEGRIKLFEFDTEVRIKRYKLDLTDKFDQIQDVSYSPYNSELLLVTAVKNGHTDIFTFSLDNEKVKQITNDVYDDLDASFVAFSNKNGILFSSNRPSATAKGSDTSLPSDNHYNVFLVTDFGGKPELNQISQLSNLKYGNARYPMQYNANHFTFISDENGIGNRYAGFFNTKRSGLDTLVLIGDDILHNPSAKEVDSTLTANKKTDIDSIAVVSISEDSAYTFPLTNYQSSVAETRIAGENNQVSEVTRQSDEKIVYKLNIDENTLNKRNVKMTPTTYMKSIVMADKIIKEAALIDTVAIADTLTKKEDVFQTEFENEKPDSSLLGKTVGSNTNDNENVLQKAKFYKYKPVKFYVDYGGAELFNNAILLNKYQPYQNGLGPVTLQPNTVVNGFVKFAVSELLEDTKILGGFRISSDLKDHEWLLSYQNFKRRIDWGATYYRSNQGFGFTIGGGGPVYPGKTLTNLYQANVSYPFDESKRLQLTAGIRSDRNVFATIPDPNQSDKPFIIPDVHRLFQTSSLQYVYDNTLNPAQNIWNGLRYKAFIEWNTDISKEKFATGKFNFNWGFDVRYYYPIYRNFIWAGRAAGDFSWGSQKTVYYLGGADGWFKPSFNSNNTPAADQTYAFQSLAVNMRGFIQNVANGNNAVTINSEFRLPVFSTLFNRPINNAFLRNFQLIQFVDLGTAWNGGYNGIRRPENIYGAPPVQVRLKVGGVGPFAGGYGFGARSTLLGYFLKFDVGWPMSGVFRGSPVKYVCLGLDF